MEAELEIVAVTGALWAQVHTLLQCSYRSEAELVDYPALPPLSDTLADLQQSGETFVAAVRTGRALGCISWETTDEALMICRLGVNRTARRQGVARALIRHAIGAGRGGPVRVQTGAGNHPAVALYARAGFRETRRWRLPDGLELVELALGGPARTDS